MKPLVVTAGEPTQPARDVERGILERHHVAVGRDADALEEFLALEAGEAGRPQVDEREVHVGAAGHEAQAAFGQRLGEHGAVLDICRCSLWNSWLWAMRRHTALAAMTCMSGPPCMPGNTALSIASACSARHMIMPPRGPRRVLCVVNVTTSQ